MGSYRDSDFEERFEAFVRTDRRGLVRFATNLTSGDAHLADDIVQAALVRVYLARHAPRDRLGPYVRRAIVNGLVDHKRRLFVRRERTMDEVPEHPAPAPADSVDPQLLTALGALPVRMRAAVVLRHVEGLSVDEAADVLGCSTGNVKSQTARGLDKLRDALAELIPNT